MVNYLDATHVRDARLYGLHGPLQQSLGKVVRLLVQILSKRKVKHRTVSSTDDEYLTQTHTDTLNLQALGSFQYDSSWRAVEKYARLVVWRRRSCFYSKKTLFIIVWIKIINKDPLVVRTAQRFPLIEIKAADFTHIFSYHYTRWVSNISLI